MSAKELMLEIAKQRREELDGEIAQREADIEKSKVEEEGWRKEAQAALDAAEACERQREGLRAQIETLHQEGLAIDVLCGLTRQTLPSPKVEAPAPVLEPPVGPQLPPIPDPLDAWGSIRVVIGTPEVPVVTVLHDEPDGSTSWSFDETPRETKPMGNVERPVDGFYEEPIRQTIPEESINAAARRMLEDRPGRFLTPGQAAQYILQAHDDWRQDITLRRLTKMVEKLYENWVRTGEIAEHSLERGQGGVAYQAKPHAYRPPATTAEVSKKGGKSRWAGISPEERSAQMKKTAESRWKGKTAEEIKAHSEKMNRAKAEKKSHRDPR